jgi:hypothetical protein
VLASAGDRRRRELAKGTQAMTRITALSAALLYGPARRETVFRTRVSEQAGRSSGRIIERMRLRLGRPSSNLSLP